MTEYTTAQVAELTGVTEARVRRFVALGLLEPTRGPRGEHRFGFQDVALLRAWAKLPGSSPARIRRAVDDCRRVGAGAASLAGDGAAIVARDATGAWDPATGQRLLAFDPGRAETVARLPSARSPEHVVSLDLHAEGVSGTTTPAPRTNALDRSADPDGDDAATMLERGRQRHEAGDPREAARLYERAAALCELSLAVTAWFNLGVAREDLGDHAGALQAYRAALEVDPRCADAHYNAARLCELSGDQVGALRHLKAYSTCPSR